MGFYSIKASLDNHQKHKVPSLRHFYSLKAALLQRNSSKRIRDAAFFLIIMLVTFAATLLKPQNYVSSRTIQKCVEHVSTST